MLGRDRPSTMRSPAVPRDEKAHAYRWTILLILAMPLNILTRAHVFGLSPASPSSGLPHHLGETIRCFLLDPHSPSLASSDPFIPPYPGSWSVCLGAPWLIPLLVSSLHCRWLVTHYYTSDSHLWGTAKAPDKWRIWSDFFHLANASA